MISKGSLARAHPSRGSVERNKVRALAGSSATGGILLKDRNRRVDVGGKLQQCSRSLGIRRLFGKLPAADSMRSQTLHCALERHSILWLQIASPRTLLTTSLAVFQRSRERRQSPLRTRPGLGRLRQGQRFSI